jgi:hypothetical protein
MCSIAAMQSSAKSFGDNILSSLAYTLSYISPQTSSLVQLFGVTSSNRLKALIYNDGQQEILSVFPRLTRMAWQD